jgi:short subunit dehydrogenase-like uncharacterized protein
MSTTPWMIYGATGYTGSLLAEHAVQRGHRPILAGRSEKKLAPLAARLDLPYRAVPLDDAGALDKALDGVALVFHAAGPFTFTSAPMIRACLATGAHYLDITGEITVFENTFTHDELARQRGIALISGAGFDVIPTDCMASYVARQVPNATELQIAIAASTLKSPSAGTAQSMLEMFGTHGGLVRREGALHPHALARSIRRVRFADRKRTVVSIPWGDLSTAYRTTGIPNITTFMALPKRTATLTSASAPLAQAVLSVRPLRRLAQKATNVIFSGPSETQRRTGGTHVWARASDDDGNDAQAWLTTSEAYQFTVEAGLRCAERVLDSDLTGAHTPAMAFGTDFVLEIEGTKRYDMLPSHVPGNS